MDWLMDCTLKRQKGLFIVILNVSFNQHFILGSDYKVSMGFKVLSIDFSLEHCSHPLTEVK